MLSMRTKTDKLYSLLVSEFGKKKSGKMKRQSKLKKIFAGNMYYVFNSNVLAQGYPKPLTDLGLPAYLDKIDAALVWGHNNRTYFYSGTLYWRYVKVDAMSSLYLYTQTRFPLRFDEDVKHIELDYPRDMSIWRGIGYHIDAAFQWKNGK